MAEALVEPNLTGVPETMLWTLHNRASEARRPDSILRDLQAVQIYRQLDYDYLRAFGPPEPSHAIRSRHFDEVLERFLARHSDAVLIHWGEGLETQRFRLAHPQALWLSIDMPEALALRERFMQPDAQHLHLAYSALDTRWFEHVPPGRPVFITAQGLLMYFEPEQVKQLLQEVGQRFAGATLLFDGIPAWFSRKTLAGWQKTPSYRMPPMPWGLNQSAMVSTLKAWVPGAQVEIQPFRFPRGAMRWMLPLCQALPGLKEIVPAIYQLRFPAKS